MKQLYLVANWKSNKTVHEAKEWLLAFSRQLSAIRLTQNITIILCAPFTVLAPLKIEIEKLRIPIHLGAQDVSPFGKGAYTGEINADMLKELVEYVLLGHSERRKYFKENREELAFELLQAQSAGLKVIYCVENSDISVPLQVDLVAYEPIAAIGSGKAENPNDAKDICKQLKEKYPGVPILYGGSVTSDNIVGFLTQPSIDGALIGGASLDPNNFFTLIQAISSYE